MRRVRWQQACRIVPTRYPAVTLFDRVADAADFDALYALEAMTNERVRDELGAGRARAARPSASSAPAAGRSWPPSRTSTCWAAASPTASYGVFYAARERATAVAETRHHHGRFLAATKQRPMHLPMRLYHVAIDARLHDLRPAGSVPTRGLRPRRLRAPRRRWAARLHAAGSAGVAYRSVRHARGQCVGLFRPRGASRCLHAAYLLYAWDGERFTDVYEKTE